MQVFRAYSLMVILILFQELSSAQTGDLEKHIDSLQKSLVISIKDSSKIETLLHISVLYSTRMGVGNGIGYAQEGLSIAKELGYSKLTYKAYLHLAYAYGFGIKDSIVAERYFDTAINLATRNRDEEFLAGIYLDKGSFYMVMKNNAKDLEYRIKSLETYKKTGNKVLIARAYSLIGDTYVNLSNYPETIKYWSKAMDLYQELGMISRVGHLHRSIAWIMVIQGSYAEALYHSLEGKKIEEQQFGTSSVNTNRNIGEIYNYLGNYKEALRYLDSALSKAGIYGQKLPYAAVYYEIGKVYYKKENCDSSLHYYDLAFDNMEPMDSLLLANNARHKGRALIKQAEKEANEGRSEKSKQLISAAKVYQKIFYDFIEREKSRDGMQEYLTDHAEALSFEGTLYPSKTGRRLFQDAVSDYTQALAIAKEIGTKQMIYECYSGLATTYQRLQDFENAYYYSRLGSIVKDSLISAEAMNRMSQQVIDYETQKVQAEEKLAQERQKSSLEFQFSRKEDSLKFEKMLAESRLQQEVLLSSKTRQELLLKQTSLNLSLKQNEINRLAFEKSQLDLQAEQGRRLENEKLLRISEQEKVIRDGKLKLQQAEIELTESDLASQKRQRVYLGGGFAIILLVAGYLFQNNRKKLQMEAQVEKEKSRAEKAISAHKMAELELQGLRSQLNPHFMFNALNAIQELILKEDNDNSHLYLSRFSDLLRMMLDNSNQALWPLARELNFLHLYLSLEKLRIPDLQSTFDIDKEINSNDIMLPNMILQPYIENAIWHGLSPKNGLKKLTINVKSSQNDLIISIADNGIGRKRAAELKNTIRRNHKSLGMELLSKRFNLLARQFETLIDVQVRDLEDNDGSCMGTRVEIRIPLNLTNQSTLSDHENYQI